MTDVINRKMLFTKHQILEANALHDQPSSNMPYDPQGRVNDWMNNMDRASTASLPASLPSLASTPTTIRQFEQVKKAPPPPTTKIGNRTKSALDTKGNAYYM
jgi:hypothetical protein